MNDREEFRHWVARTLFVTAWADWKDQYGGGAPGNGCNLMEEAPETPVYVYQSADDLIEKLGDVDALIAKAKAVWKPERKGGGSAAEELGYCMAMQAMGHGVGWTDYQEPFEGWHPSVHFEYSYFDLDDEHYPIPEEHVSPEEFK